MAWGIFVKRPWPQRHVKRCHNTYFFHFFIEYSSHPRNTVTYHPKALPKAQQWALFGAWTSTTTNIIYRRYIMYNIEFQFHLNICKYNVQWNLSKSIICMTYKNIMYQQLTIVCWQTVIRKITSCHWMWFLQWNCPLGIQILNLETEAICFELFVWTTKVKHQKRVI